MDNGRHGRRAVTALLADAPPVSDLLDVFNAYDGSVVFRGLTEGVGGQPAVLGAIGWIFTGFGALFVLWGFVLRSQRSQGEDKLGEIAKTLVVTALVVGGPFLMRTAMQGADSVYASSPGGPQNLTTACVKAAYAMPELNQLFDVLRKSAMAQGGTAAVPGSTQRQALVSSANDGSVLGYLEAYGVELWDTASGYASNAAQTWNGMVRMVAMAAGMGSAMLKCLLIALTIVPLYLLFLAAAAIVWFMVQLRYFLAVSGTMMLPLFTGMFSLPEGHFNRQAAQSYVMHMISLSLWPVAWAIGHTGTISLYNALVSLIAGTSRVPDIVGVLQWGSITTGAPSEAQVQATEAALGNWFMGNLTALLSILVGGIGFVLWVVIVSVLGPAFLHKLLATGMMFMTQAAGTTARQAAVAGKLAVTAVQSAWAGGTPGLPTAGPSAGERLAAANPAEAAAFLGFGGHGPAAGSASMQGAARFIDDSGGKTPPPV
jgi:hypothetical protein